MPRNPIKRSHHELKRLIEEAVSEQCDLRARGLWLCVDDLEVVGHPPSQIRVWATLHFLPTGSPFCCGEPGCHLGLPERLPAINDHLRRSMGMTQPVTVDFGEDVAVCYHEGVAFKRDDPDDSSLP